MKVIILATVALGFLWLAAGESSNEGDESHILLFADVISVIKQQQEKLSQHPFFKMLADKTIPPRQRMTFAPYWAYFALAGADLLDTWLYIPNPQTELEERINNFIEEDNFHYNLFLHDMDQVFGYTVDRFGSYSAVMRHMYGADSKAVRELVYAWTVAATKFDDPLITLATFEIIEAGLKDFFETVYTNVFLAEEEFKGLHYFGKKHVELEINHTLTSWFKGDNPLRPLAELEITPLQKEHALEAVDMMFDKLYPAYDALHKLSLVEDSIWPEKYQVGDTLPPMRAFPPEHPNRMEYIVKEEL